MDEIDGGATGGAGGNGGGGGGPLAAVAATAAALGPDEPAGASSAAAALDGVRAKEARPSTAEALSTNDDRSRRLDMCPTLSRSW